MIVTQGYVFENYDHVDAHLRIFSEYSISHHDNIDDESHSHTHKHSENGEEHEHSHEHSKTAQVEIKLCSDAVKVLSRIILVETTLGVREKSLISTPHPNDIYRPPINS